MEVTSVYTGDESTVTSSKRANYKRITRVSDAVAPATMFQRMKGNTNADLIEQTTSNLSKHAFRVSSIDGGAANDAMNLMANIRLLREIPPYCKDPLAGRREEWNGTCSFKNCELGSRVQAAASSTSFNIRKNTIY